MQKNSSGGKKGEIRRSKKLKELPCTLLQSTDFLENWAQILSDLELQDTAQTDLHLAVKGGLCDAVVAESVPTECSLGRVLMDVCCENLGLILSP